MTKTLKLAGVAKLNPDAVEKGVVLTYPGSEVTARILPAAMWNPRVRRHIAAGSGNDDRPIMEFFRDPAFVANALVLDLDLLDENGERVPYTPELGEQIFADPEYAHFREWVVGQAQSVAQFYAESLETDSGNSRNGSSGKRAGAGRSKKTRS